MRVRFVLASVVGLVASLVGPSVTAALAAIEVIAGVCVFQSVDVDFSNPALGPDLDKTTVHFDGSGGLCATTGDPTVGAGHIEATVAPTLGTDMNCLAGLADGTGTFAVDPQLSSMDTEVALVNVGGLWTVAFTSGLNLIGVGTFVQLPTETVDCTVGGLSSTTWTGVVVFEDPRVA